MAEIILMALQTMAITVLIVGFAYFLGQIVLYV